MRRRLFNLLAAVSLVLCVATAAMWVRSYWVLDGAGWVNLDKGACIVTSSKGRAEVSVVMGIGARGSWSSDVEGWFYRTQLATSLDTSYISSRITYVDAFGFTYETWQKTAFKYYWLIVPWWFPTLLVAAVAGWAIIRSRHAGPRSPGLCPACGYDLRATPGRCPECGAVAAKPARHQVGPAGGGPVRSG